MNCSLPPRNEHPGFAGPERCAAIRLKLEAEAQLQYPREASAGRDLAKRRAADVRIATAELRGVRQVEHLETDLRRAASKGRFLRDDGVDVVAELISVVTVVAWRCPVRAHSGIRVGGRIQ